MLRLPDAGVADGSVDNDSSMEQVGGVGAGVGVGGPMVDVSFLDAAAKLDKEMEQYENDVEISADQMKEEGSEDTIDSVCQQLIDRFEKNVAMKKEALISFLQLLKEFLGVGKKFRLLMQSYLFSPDLSMKISHFSETVHTLFLKKFNSYSTPKGAPAWRQNFVTGI